MDVTTILKADHRKVDELFSQIEAASERAVKTKKKLFQQIKVELTLHAAVEENILYPRMRELRELRHYAFEAIEEHRLVKQLLAEISALGGDSASDGTGGARTGSSDGTGGQEAWSAKVKVLIDMVRHHVREEEGEMFKGLKAELDRDELRELGEAVMSFKQSYREAPEAAGAAMPMAQRGSDGRGKAGADADMDTAGEGEKGMGEKGMGDMAGDSERKGLDGRKGLNGARGRQTDLSARA